MRRRFLKTLLIISIVILTSLIIFSCVVFIKSSLEGKDFDQRLTSFPVEHVPLEESATIYWNQHLVPFIEAQTDADAAFLLGMVHMHLRFSQMTLFRRVVYGRLSESAGPFTASIDHSLRILDLGMISEKIEAQLPEETRAWMEAYVRGINHYQDHIDEYPTDFSFMDLEKEPWTVKDIITVGRLVGVDVSWFNYFSFLKLRNRKYWPEFWNRLIDLGLQSSPSFSALDSPLPAIFNSMAKSGSNAFVISPERTIDGEAIMASDPHLGIQLPNTWVITGYKSPSYHVIGLMFPGIPMVLIGRNPAVAWGGTNMRSASSELYRIEKSKEVSIESEKQHISVRWWFDRDVEVRRTKLGPILSDMPVIKGIENDETLALRWVGHEVSDEFSTFLQVNKSTDWGMFKNAFKTYAVSGQNFLYADSAGNIGQVLAVRAPVRPLVRPAGLVSDISLQWQGYKNPDELPSVYNPAKGFIVSANNRPVVTEPPVGYFYSSNDRVDRLSDLLANQTNISFDMVAEFQQDVLAPSAIYLKNVIYRQFKQYHPEVFSRPDWSIFLENLSTWDGQYKKELTGPVNFQFFLYYFIKDYYTQRYDEDIASFFLSSDNANELITQDILSDNLSLLQTSLLSALESAAYMSTEYATWGDMHRLQLKHPLGNIPLLGKRFQFCDLPADGSVNTVMKTAHQINNKKHNTFYGANSRFVSRLNDQDENYFVVLGGQDGWLGSNYFLDQVPLWRKGVYIKIPLRIQEIRTSFSTHMQLKPAR